MASNIYEQISKYCYMFMFDKFLKRNVGYLLHDPKTKSLIGIDFGEYPVSNKVVTLLEGKLNCRLKYLISTHSHYDHTIGNFEWKNIRKSSLQIIGGDSKDKYDTVPYADRFVNDGEDITISSELQLKAIHTPGHLNSSYCFYIRRGTAFEKPLLFTGDSLFIGGTGKFIFENTEKEYFESMKKLKTLNESSIICGGHDFTMRNLKFCKFLDSNNVTLMKVINKAKLKIKEKKLLVAITNLKEEMAFNPFLRCDSDYYKKYTNHSNGPDVFKMLMTIKDAFQQSNQIKI